MTNNLLFIAGQLGWDENSEVVPGGIGAQVRQAFKNMKIVIDEAGGSIDNIVQLMISIVGQGTGKPFMEDLGEVFSVKAEMLPNATPCGIGVQVTA